MKNTELVHYQPLPGINGNVRCLNGSAHCRTARNLAVVTCPLCLDPNTYYDTFWKEKIDNAILHRQL